MTRTLLIVGAVATAAAVSVVTRARGADSAGASRPAAVKITAVQCPSEAVAGAIRSALRERQAELLDCHVRELSADREPVTRVILSWTLRGNGSVATPRAEFAEARYDDAGFAFLGCLTSRAEGWTFPRPASGGAPVEVRLTFTEGAAPPAPPGPAAPRETSIHRESVRKVVQAHAAEIQACYDRELKVDPRLDGTVTLRWTVQADGSVTAAAVEDATTTLRSRTVEECMLSRLGRWRFAKPKDGGSATVTNSWTFRRTETVVP